ncbi:hypothetical protein HS041_18405 [Planomonospora sp. ID67723]|uniref:hypothetical protein n=1 Tax=Planomonospora sp. ID67723 TaxID=2738134 RepID=UPI0018C39BFE|nr:hypothetical protein [Planomonospora sp. ID67723]MBG0829739.1 hypothetical protein [Planomonospora sp. ID67723]
MSIAVDGDAAVLAGEDAVTVTIGGAGGTWNLEPGIDHGVHRAGRAKEEDPP